MINKCKTCNKEYKTYLCRKNSKFCSQKCAGEWKSIHNIGKNNPRWKGGKIIKVCEICGKEFKVKPSEIGRFCSHKCYGQYQSKNRINENAQAWKGGLSYGKYCSKFNESLKQSIRNRYNNCDYISGIHKSVCNNNKNLDVHHVSYDKEEGCNGEKFNLIPLSKSNHGKTNKNRSFWNKLFIYSLEYEKEYGVI